MANFRVAYSLCTFMEYEFKDLYLNIVRIYQSVFKLCRPWGLQHATVMCLWGHWELNTIHPTLTLSTVVATLNAHKKVKAKTKMQLNSWRDVLCFGSLEGVLGSGNHSAEQRVWQVWNSSGSFPTCLDSSVQHAQHCDVMVQQHVLIATSYAIFNIRVCNQRCGISQIFSFIVPGTSTDTWTSQCIQDL